MSFKGVKIYTFLGLVRYMGDIRETLNKGGDDDGNKSNYNSGGWWVKV